jgi:hypothetical protein
LLAQEAPALEPEEIEPTLVAPFRRALKLLNIGLYALDLAVAWILLSLPIRMEFPLVGLCLLVAGGAWLWAQQPRMQVALSMGHNHLQHLALLAQHYKLLSSVLILTIFYIGYAWYPWLLCWPTYVLLLAAVILIVCYYRTRFHYGRVLPVAALRKLIHQQGQQLGLDFLVWTIVVGCASYFGVIPVSHLHAFHFSAALCMCLLWLIVNLAKSIETLYWLRLAVRRRA